MSGSPKQVPTYECAAYCKVRHMSVLPGEVRFRSALPKQDSADECTAYAVSDTEVEYQFLWLMAKALRVQMHECIA